MRPPSVPTILCEYDKKILKIKCTLTSQNCVFTFFKNWNRSALQHYVLFICCENNGGRCKSVVRGITLVLLGWRWQFSQNLFLLKMHRAYMCRSNQTAYGNPQNQPADSHAWLKNVSVTAFLDTISKKKKYANSNWWKKWKLCVNDDTFFVQIESTGSEVIFSDTRPGTGTGNVRAVLACIHYFMQIAEDFGCLWRFSNIFGNLRICLCCLRKTWHTREKILRL